MKKITMYCCHLLALTLLMVSSSCERESEVSGGVTDKLPDNVHMSDLTSSSITVAWDRAEGATSYTVQLLGSKDSETPIDAYTTTSKDFYQFGGLQEVLGYYVRVRANVDYATGNWVYIMDGQNPARIMPKYGFVDEDFEEPEPNPAKEIYPNFPEGFEIHPDEPNRKRAYGGTSDTYPSGEWLMADMYAHNVAALIHRIDTWAIMFRNNVETYLTMNFDLPYGASKFSFYYGAATRTNANEIEGLPITVYAQYSQDGGETWIPLGEDLQVTDLEVQYFQEYELDITGPVRFRIGQDDSRGRLLVDEIAVYMNE